MNRDLTRGPVTKGMLLFALPMILGNLLQQFYNVADTLIVGQFLGAAALAAVGSSYTLMTFLTSILLGMCMGSGAVFSIRFGEGDRARLKNSLSLSFLMIAAFAVVMNLAVFLLIDPMMGLLQVPEEVYPLMRSYLWVIFWGIGGTFLYNYFACLLRAIGNSATPLLFLGVSAVLNIALDLVFVVVVPWGVAGAAFATSLSQWVSGLGLLAFTLAKMPQLRPSRQDVRWEKDRVLEIARFSLLTCVQQSVMNFGILMVQGLVWHRGDGRLCRRGEDRLLRLHARAGFRQRLFHLYRPELRRQADGPGGPGHQKRGGLLGGVRPSHLRSGGCVCQAPAAALYQARGDRDPGGGGAVPAH